MIINGININWNPLLKCIAVLFYLLVFICLFMPEPASAFELLVIDSQESEPYTTVRMAMMEHLAVLGYQTESNLNVKYWSLGNAEGRALRVWVQEKDRNYDVIFLNGTVATQMFKQFAYDDDRYRFVFGAVTDPVGLGVINGFGVSPPANFTGMCYPVKVEKRLGFIKKCLPEAKHIGFIYADMQQSHSYMRWIKQALNGKEFNDLTFHFRKVPLVETENGHLRMALLAKEHIKELNPKVDVFLSPNDQLGIQQAFSKLVWENASKPLIGLSKEDVMEGWGAAMAIYPDMTNSGMRIAEMIGLLFQGKTIKEIKPEWPKYSYAFDLRKLKHFGITIPEELLSNAKDSILTE